MNIQDALRFGYFPQELPPDFVTASFANVCTALTAPRPPKGSHWTIPTTLNLARPGSLRRRLSIPNPFSQLDVATVCAAGWKDIRSHVKRSGISLSRPVNDPTHRRAVVTRVSFGDRPRQRARRMHRSRYRFVSDVSECYASIYTHSLEWALHGKTASKARLGARASSLPLGAQLDVAVRAGQDGQTKGIPISPDTSLVLAEIVLCAIDAELQAAHPGIEPRCLRFMDDLEFYASTQTEAEEVLLTWQSLLATYELMVNPTKTSITEEPSVLEAPWRTTLAQFNFRGTSDQVAANDLLSFFSTAFQLAKVHRQDAVLSYAVSTAVHRASGPESWATLQSLASAAGTIDPSCLRYVAAAFDMSLAAGVPLQRSRVSENLNDLCEYHAKREHGSEVTWALWILRHLGLKLTEAAARSVSAMRDNCALLLLFDLIAMGKIDGAHPDMTVAVARAEVADAWRSEDWLLAYECARNGWASDKAMRAESHWNELLALGVEFFKASVLPTPPPPGRTPKPRLALTPKSKPTVPMATPRPETTPKPKATPVPTRESDPWWLVLLPTDYPGT